MKRRSALVMLIVVAVAGYAAVSAPPGPRSIRTFNPNRLADLEVRMWQAYYAKQNVRLFGLLVTMLREQYRYSWATAAREGFHLARAAATFGAARSNYEVVLPDLEAAYGTAREWLGARFDSKAVARSELAWWVQRRIPGANSPAQVGGLIADEYAMLYEAPRESVLAAALLRAEAGALRDAQAAEPDWERIRRLLLDSYVALAAAVGSGPAKAGPHD
ncbi:MAG TPA: hypothetical protein VH436_27775 [Vicinamibacterales bacterium]|jgi:hypothetical protein